MFKLFLLVLQVIKFSNAQFPSDCINTLTERKCCPVFQNSECGSAIGRGECSSITLPEGSSVRDKWPYYFDQVCICTSNYAGYDCSRCKYGYHGENCEHKEILKRRPISELSSEEWKKYVEIIDKSKNYDSGYKVLLSEPTESNPMADSTNISLYNLFVWQHNYPSKDNEIGKLSLL